MAAALLRAAATLALGFVVFAALIVFLVAANFTRRLEDPEVYKAAAVSDAGAYGRVYDEVPADGGR